MKVTNFMIRRLVLLLLDDEEGITENAWGTMMTILVDTGNDDIIAKVKAINGRFYLSDDHGFDVPTINQARQQ